jgi:hypothetical protein
VKGNPKCIVEVAFGMRYFNKLSKKEGRSDDLKMINVCVIFVEGGNLPPLSSSIRDKIFRGF